MLKEQIFSWLGEDLTSVKDQDSCAASLFSPFLPPAAH